MIFDRVRWEGWSGGGWAEAVGQAGVGMLSELGIPLAHIEY